MQQQLSSVRWGILGTGRIAHDFVTALSTTPATVVAVGSRDIISATAFATKHSIPSFFGSYEELVQNDQVDVIYVASPNSAHKEHTLLALRNGKHVLCEKTFTLNEQEAIEVVNLARDRSLFLMEANWMPFWPLFGKMRQLIKDGVIGDVEFVKADLGFKNNHEANPAILNLGLGGGALLACGIYPVTLASFVFESEPIEISAYAKLNASTGADETVSMILKYGATGIASLSTSISAFLDSEAVIFGSKGKIRLDYMHCCPTKLTVSVDGKEPVVYEDSLPEKVKQSEFNFPNSEGLMYEALHVMQCLVQKKTESEVMPLSKTLANMRTMDEIRRKIGLKFPAESE